MAERVGFEPTVTCATTVFETAPINHSGTPPRFMLAGNPARGGIRTRQPTDYKSVALPLRHSGIENMRQGKTQPLYYTYVTVKSQDWLHVTTRASIHHKTVFFSEYKSECQPHEKSTEMGLPGN